MGPTNVFDKDKIITLVVLSLFFIGFFQNFVFAKKKPIVRNDVCPYTVLGVCVWLYKGKRYSPLA